MQLLHLILIFSAHIILAHATPTEDVENDCCQLEWLPLIEYNSKRFIPPTAVLAARSQNGINWFFIKGPNPNFRHGVINDVVTDEPAFIPGNDQPIVRAAWTGGVILSNPNQCVLGWEHRTKGTFAKDTEKKRFPKTMSVNGGNHFTSHRDSSTGQIYAIGYSWDPYWFNWPVSLETLQILPPDDEYEQLFVDCEASRSHQPYEFADQQIRVSRTQETLKVEAINSVESKDFVISAAQIVSPPKNILFVLSGIDWTGFISQYVPIVFLITFLLVH